jgi:nucleotide-binding universal stress UspA family protein
MFQRLLICTSLADGLQRLVHFTHSFAVAGVQQLVFLHVVPLEGRGIPKPNEAKIKQATDLLSVALADAPPGLEIKVEVQAGRPDEAILNTARNHQVDLVVLGSESRSLLTEKLFGSTATSLCHSNRLPVLILRPQLVSTYTVAELDLRCRYLFRYLLIPYDGRKTAELLLSQIEQQALRHRTITAIPTLEECLLLHVLEDNDRLEKLLHDSRLKEAEAQMAAAKAQLEAAQLKVITKVEQGDPIYVTMQAAMDYDITAIAIATATMGRLAEWSVPSFAAELLRRSWHPVLFFPSQA